MTFCIAILRNLNVWNVDFYKKNVDNFNTNETKDANFFFKKPIKDKIIFRCAAPYAILTSFTTIICGAMHLKSCIAA
jgi:hypothetical protein